MDYSSETAVSEVFDLVGACTRALFAEYGVGIPSSSASPAAKVDMWGIASFADEGIRACVRLGVSRSLLLRSAPMTGGLERDWTGELANQLLGRVKNQLRMFGVNVSTDVPTVVDGDQLSIESLEGAMVLEDKALGLVVWLEADGSFDLGPPADDIGLREGEMLLF